MYNWRNLSGALGKDEEEIMSSPVNPIEIPKGDFASREPDKYDNAASLLESVTNPEPEVPVRSEEVMSYEMPIPEEAAKEVVPQIQKELTPKKSLGSIPQVSSAVPSYKQERFDPVDMRFNNVEAKLPQLKLDILKNLRDKGAL